MAQLKIKCDIPSPVALVFLHLDLFVLVLGHEHVILAPSVLFPDLLPLPAHAHLYESWRVGGIVSPTSQGAEHSSQTQRRRRCETDPLVPTLPAEPVLGLFLPPGRTPRASGGDEHTPQDNGVTDGDLDFAAASRSASL